MADEIEILSPTLVAKGRFALYKTPEGGVHMTLELDGEEVKHFDIPPMMLAMIPGAKQMFKGL